MTRAMTAVTSSVMCDDPVGVVASPKAVKCFRDSASPGTRPEIETPGPDMKRVPGTLGVKPQNAEPGSPESPGTPERYPKDISKCDDVPDETGGVRDTSRDEKVSMTTTMDADALFFPSVRTTKDMPTKSKSKKKPASSSASKHNPITRAHWVPDRDARRCHEPSCDVAFSAFARRHHCRCCGNVFCRKCADARLLLDPETAKPVTSCVMRTDGEACDNAIAARVCFTCYGEAFLPGAARVDVVEGRKRDARAKDDDERSAFPVSEDCSESTSDVSSSDASRVSDASWEGIVCSTKSARSTTLRRNPPVAFLEAFRGKIEPFAIDPAKAATNDTLKGTVGTNYTGEYLGDTGECVADTVGECLSPDTGNTGVLNPVDTTTSTPVPKTNRETRVSFSFATPVSLSFREDLTTKTANSTNSETETSFESPRGDENDTTKQSPLETVEAMRVRRDTADLLARVPDLLFGTPENPGGVDGDGLKRLVTRFTFQLKEQSSLTEDAAFRLREQLRKNASTEEGTRCAIPKPRLHV